MSKTYKYSYKVGENLLNSLAVYNVGHQQCEPGYQWGPGIRDHYSIHHVISGEGHYTVGGRTYHLRAGDTFILYPNAEVQYMADVSNPWEYAWVGFKGNDAGSILYATDFSNGHPVIEQKVPGDLIKTQLNQIFELRGNNYEDAVAMAGALYTLLAGFMRYADKKDSEKDLQFTYMEKAKDYIETSYSYPITVEEIAEYVGVSRSHLYRSFQTYMHQSPKEYLTQFRLKRACHLLKETQLSIASIAYSVGFENNLYFSKAFKLQKKTSPSQYRQQKSGGANE
ncbi:MAG: AraC family transcriptional regulator [Hespellia sp.]|nr:AraC family transcriptional regulator [Hespellia sp.]